MNPSVSEPASAASGPRSPATASGRTSSRRRRLTDYRRQALANPDALQANLSVVNADLIEIGSALAKHIRLAQRRSSNPLRDFPELEKALQSFYNCARLVQRFTLLDERFGPPPREASGNPAGSTLADVRTTAHDLPDELQRQFDKAGTVVG